MLIIKGILKRAYAHIKIQLTAARTGGKNAKRTTQKNTLYPEDAGGRAVFSEGQAGAAR